MNFKCSIWIRIFLTFFAAISAHVAEELVCPELSETILDCSAGLHLLGTFHLEISSGAVLSPTSKH